MNASDLPGLFRMSRRFSDMVLSVFTLLVLIALISAALSFVWSHGLQVAVILLAVALLIGR